MDPVEAARAFVVSHFPGSCLSFLAGSVARGQPTATSDLDILVITEVQPAPYKESFFEHGWPIETFVHSPSSVLAWMDRNTSERKSSMASIITDGLWLAGDQALAGELKAQARGFIQAGPKAFSASEDLDERYGITEFLDDLIGSDRYDEQLFILHELLGKLINYQLVKEGKWRVSGKFLPRAALTLDNGFHSNMMLALEAFHKNRSKTEIIDFISKILAHNGGRYFAGHIQGR